MIQFKKATKFKKPETVKTADDLIKFIMEDMDMGGNLEEYKKMKPEEVENIESISVSEPLRGTIWRTLKFNKKTL
jgi:hypothetical protein